MGSSLATLTDSLKKSSHDYALLKQSSLLKDKKNNELKMERLLEKGIFPYDLLHDVSVLYEYEQLPPLEKFYSSLTEIFVA